MDFSLLTYNVLYNRAYNKLTWLISRYKPDIICLQEIDTNENNLRKLEEFDYLLADYENSFIKFEKIYGIATYYNKKKFSLAKSRSINLSNSLTETILTVFQLLLGFNKPRTVLQTDFIDNLSKEKLAIFNIHLILFATNALRIKHIKQVLSDSVVSRKKEPIIIAGDFNYYPYGRKMLENFMKSYGLSEATQNVGATMKWSADGKLENYNLIQRLSVRFVNKTMGQRFRLKTDYVFYKNLKLKETKKINAKFSDHYPIISYFSF